MLATTTFALALTLKNCSNPALSVPIPGAYAAASVLGQFAVFANEGHASQSADAGKVFIFDSKTASWRTGQRLSAARTNMCATTWKHLAIFAGGTDERGQPKSKVVDVWDSTTDTWTAHSLSIGRDLLACASAGDYTLFAGGSAPQVNQSETDSVELMNHVTGEWTRARLSQPRKKPEAVGVGGRIVIAGGEIAKPHGAGLGDYSAVMDIFDAATLQWSNDSLAGARQYFGAAHAAGAAVGAAGVAVFAGGFFNDIRLGSVDIYDPAARRHTAGAALSHNRSNLASTSVGGGRYAAFGAGNIDDDAKLALDFFDGETGEWAASHTHSPVTMNGVASVGNVALFMGADGRLDAFALDGDCSAVGA
jgi:hypothetical protein